MSWCFATLNNRLAEIYFDKKGNKEPDIWGHCYVKRETYKSTQEKKWIDRDTKRGRFVYRNKKYRFIPLKP